MKIEIFSDGSATIPSKPGGYGWVMVIDGQKYSEGSGFSPNASNNDMELEAAIQGLVAVLKYVNRPIEILGNYDVAEVVPPEVVLISDSQIVLGWASGAFRFSQQEKIEKYKQLQFLMKRLNASTKWVKGHGSDVHNIRCDKLANAARKGEDSPIDKKVRLLDTKIGTKKLGVASVWYKDILKVIDFETGIIENYSRELHGKRGSIIEIREGKDR